MIDSIKYFLQKYHQRKSGTAYKSILELMHIDVFLLFWIFALIAVGLIVLYSAEDMNASIITQQILHFCFALLIMFLLAQLPPYFYYRWAPYLYTASVIILMLVLVVGHANKGAQRWLSLGLFDFQPSEIMKITIPMMLAWYFSQRNLPPKTNSVAVSALIILVPVVLIIKQPDLGTAMILICAGASILFLAGMRLRLILFLIVVIFILTPVIWHFMHGYQKQRILIFINPEHDPLGAGYHIIQSKIAIGSGGLFGKGWLHGTQSHLHFLPENATDFIFAVCGEEFGLFGSVILILIYIIIVFRSFYIAFNAQDTFSRLLAGSMCLTFFFSFFVNIGMVSGILPVVGLPLPLISYGGSYMVTLMASFGILMSIQCHRRLISK